MTDDVDQSNFLEDAIQKIQFYLERNNLQGAKTEINKVLTENPDNGTALYYSAYVDKAEDNYDAAEATLTSVLSSQPNDYYAQQLLADVYIEQKKYAEAEQLLIRILKDYPDDVDAYVDYAWLMLETMNIDKAMVLSQEAIKRAPDNQRALQISVIGSLIQNGVNDETREQLQKLGEQFPDTTSTCMTMVSILVEEGRNKEAYEISQEVLRINPSSSSALEVVKELKVINHWSMTPLRPLSKYGWGASIAIWAFAVIGFRVIDKTPLAPYSTPILLVFLAFVIYSWVWPPILRKLIAR